MKFLHSWIQDYIQDKIPEGEEFVEKISTNAFEVEEFNKIENPKEIVSDKIPEIDYIYDLNILPNRAHDALSHYFLAKEVATLFDFKLKNILQDLEEFKKDLNIEKTNTSFIKIQETKECSRFIGVRVEGVEVAPSPNFIKYRLESIGEKSINNIVDITNYVQFSFNKPMHAYDANLVNKFLEVRFAKENEKMLTLDNRDLDLNEDTLVIADSENVLALAGIKGGKYSGITDNTNKVIIESANFNPISIRKTSGKYNLKTDASKRFENGIADSLVEIGTLETLRLIKEYASGENFKILEIVDNFPKEKQSSWKYKVSVSLLEINKILGINLEEKEVEDILKKLDFDYKIISPKKNIENLIEVVLNKKYKSISSMREDAPEAFSCSSLVSYLYEGIYMPSVSVDKYLFTKRENINKDNLKFGDLIFRNSEEGKIYYEGIEYKKGERVEEGVDHVGIYLGENKVLHSSRDLENGTEIESLEKFFNKGKIVGFGRVVDDMEEERFVVEIPSERLDLRIKEDIVEEIVRVYGLDKIVSVLPNLNKSGIFSKKLYYENKIKNILLESGFSEVMAYSLRNKGDIKIIKSVAQDKNMLRTNLSDGIGEIIEKNIFNMPLLDTREMKVFEFGNIFSLENGKEKEKRNLAIAFDDGKKNKEYKSIIEEILNKIKEELKLENINYIEYKNLRQKENRIEIDFESLIKDLEEINTSKGLEEKYYNKEVKYEAFPLTPFIVRDIACWVSKDITEKDIEKIILENIGELCKSVKLFDKFEKEIDGEVKKSFAFRLIYQDKERTLTDEEVNKEADKIYKALKEKGLEIR